MSLENLNKLAELIRRESDTLLAEWRREVRQLPVAQHLDVPTLNEVQQKIEARYTKAKASSELQETSVESRILEVEQATANVEAQGRLSELRAELGLDGAPAPAALDQPAAQEGTAQPG